MTETAIGIIGLLALIALFLTGLEMAFAMAIVGVAGYAVVVGPTAAVNMLANDFVDSVRAYGITVIPLFMLMGQIVFNGGLARRLYDSSYKFLGHIPGGLAVATVVGAGVFKAMCGSAAATSATFASVAVPEMDRFGYRRELSTGVVATVGTLGMLIPPAGTLILLGIITQQSIGKLFVAGIIPGIILAILFVAVIIGWARVNPSIGPKGPRFPWRDRARALPELAWPALIFVVMIGGLMKGIFTPTEAGAVGVFCVLLVTTVKRDIGLAGIKKSTAEALRTTNMIVLLIATSTMLGHFITAADIPNDVAKFVADLPFQRSVTLIIIFAVYMIGGTFMDDLAFLILATPIFWPAMIKLGYDPIWLCITMSVVLGIGSIIPPMAICVFIVKQVTGVPIGVVYRGVYPFLIALVACLALLFLFPDLVLYLPRAVMG